MPSELDSPWSMLSAETAKGKQEGSRFEASWVDRLEHDDPPVDEGEDEK